MHSGMHQAAGGIFIVLEQIDDVAGLFHIVDVRQDLVAVFLVELLDYVYGIVGVEMVDELLGDLLGRHVLEQLAAVVLIEFHKHIGRNVVIEQLVEKFRLVEIEVLVQFGYVGRMQRGELVACRVFIS